MSDPPEVLDVEVPDPATRAREPLAPIVELEDPFQFEMSQFRTPGSRDRPLHLGVVVGVLGCFWLFFEVFAIVVFAAMGWTTAIAIGTAMWLVVVLSWASLVGGRKYWMSSHSPVDFVWNLFVRREAAPLVVNEAPAQLLRKRGDHAGALTMYEGWAKQHTDLPMLVFRMAEIQHHDLKNRQAAARLYRQFAAHVRAATYRPTAEDEEHVRIAEVLADELIRV